MTGTKDNFEAYRKSMQCGRREGGGMTPWLLAIQAISQTPAAFAVGARCTEGRRPWTPEEDAVLVRRLKERATHTEIAEELDRPPSSIGSRINTLRIRRHGAPEDQPKG